MGSELSEAIADLEAFARGEVPRDHYVVDVSPARTGEKSWTAGYPDYRPGMDALWAALSEAGMGAVTAEAYNAWLARKAPPLQSPDQVASLERDELLLRLFVIRRHERFCDGHWTSALEGGWLLAFARRLAALAEG